MSPFVLQLESFNPSFTIQGDQGLPGSPGAKGETGDKGQKGDDGEKGKDGRKGIVGDMGDKGEKVQDFFLREYSQTDLYHVTVCREILVRRDIMEQMVCLVQKERRE